ncbi:MAG: fatty acid desaturase [Candidatus Omnitrophica bacterium]|nr:fatty acid desaturase [Candidatus Omnitrophota bacterium]
MLAELENQPETEALSYFRAANPDLFEKQDSRLALHLGIVIGLLFVLTSAAIFTPLIGLKILLGIMNSFLWFCLINVTIHHHHTHHNAAKSGAAKRLLDLLYHLAVPNAPKRLTRYVRAHLNHHARPFHETDVDHYYGTNRYLAVAKNFWGKVFYFLELTFVGAHVPGWQDDEYMNTVPLEAWNQKDYRRVKEVEIKKAAVTSAAQWGLFFIVLKFLPAVAWGWAFPMLFVKNWAHYLGQFQHYDERLIDPSCSLNARTRTFRGIPNWINYLSGGELSGHFLHHLFPEIPYYQVEEARQRLAKDQDLASLFVID